MSKYYDILHLPKNASLKDIKSSYRELAKKYHPDKQNGDIQKFQELQKAYEILSDENKKLLYDKYGENFDKIQQQQQNSQQHPIFNIFNNLHQGMFGFPVLQKNKRSLNKFLIMIDIELSEIYTGVKKTFNLTRNISCDGDGCKNKSTCINCDGKGQRMNMFQLGPGMFSQTLVDCENCKGKGVLINCSKCNNEGKIKENELIEIEIPKGFTESDQILLAGKGDKLDGESTDCVVKIKQIHNDKISRLGNDFFLKKKISLCQSIIGGNIEIEFFNEKLKCVLHKITKPNEQKKLIGYGMNKSNYLIVEFEVEFPIGKVFDSSKIIEYFNYDKKDEIPLGTLYFEEN